MHVHVQTDKRSVRPPATLALTFRRLGVGVVIHSSSQALEERKANRARLLRGLMALKRLQGSFTTVLSVDGFADTTNFP